VKTWGERCNRADKAASIAEQPRVEPRHAHACDGIGFDTPSATRSPRSGETVMFDLTAASHTQTAIAHECWTAQEGALGVGLEQRLQAMGLQRKLVHRKDTLFHAGQSAGTLYLVRSGCFKVSLLSEDGREKITGFRMRGDLLGADALGMAQHGCDAVALDVGEVIELPYAALSVRMPEFQTWLAARMAGEIRRDWAWMLATSTLGAEQRVVAFLLDLADRQQAMGYSPEHVVLQMTRAEIGNFLALQLETVTRALSHLDSLGLIAVDRREVRLLDTATLRASIAGERELH
jgi:CRP/FNR family transcriptional regulator